MAEEEEEFDVYKDSPVRLLGYANEVGEAFRYQIGTKWVVFSYVVATAYCVADAMDKTVRVYNQHKGEKDVITKTAIATTETLIWQLLASVIISGYIINRICFVSDRILKNKKHVPLASRKYAVPMIGLLAIPFVLKPVDLLTDCILDQTFRKAFK